MEVRKERGLKKEVFVIEQERLEHSVVSLYAFICRGMLMSDAAERETRSGDTIRRGAFACYCR